MMIKCQVCNYENQMGSIFCRNCGEKIDMEKMRPENFAKEKEKTSGGGMRSFIGVILLILLLAILAGIFVPINRIAIEDPKSDALKSAQDKMETIETLFSNEALMRGQKFTFSADELTAYVRNTTTGEKKSDSTGYSVEKLGVTLDGDTINIVMDAKLAGPVSTQITVTGSLVTEEEKGTSFKSKEAKIGVIPMIGGFLQNVAVQRFEPLTNKAVLEIASKATSVEISDSKLTVTLPNKKK